MLQESGLTHVSWTVLPWVPTLEVCTHRDIVICNRDSAHVVHTDADEVEGKAWSGKDCVVLDVAILEHTVRIPYLSSNFGVSLLLSYIMRMQMDVSKVHLE